MKLDTVTFVRPVAPTHAHPHPGTRQHAEQVTPARSVASLAQAAAHAAQSEGADDVALTLGHRMRVAHQGGARTERGGASAARRALAGIYENRAESVDDALHALIDEGAALDESEDLRGWLGRARLPPGAGALVLAGLAGRLASGSKRRQQIDDMLDGLLEEDGWQLSLFGWLEFGAEAGAALPELKTLYQAALAANKPLAAWFQELRHLRGRRRKLRALLRALASSLSSDSGPLEDEHLATVLTDLKRLLIFFGLEEQCAYLAACIAEPRPRTDDVLEMLVALIDENWIHEMWLRQRFVALGLDDNDLLQFAFRVRRVVLALPAPCFREEEQREQIIEALQALVGAAPDDEFIDSDEAASW